MIEYLEGTPLVAKVGDTNGDGIRELLIVSDAGVIYRVSQKIETIGEIGEKPKALEICDINNDGIDEIVVALAAKRVVIMDRTGMHELKGRKFEYLVSADIDNDNIREIIGATSNKELYAFAPERRIWKAKIGGVPSGMRVINFGKGQFIAVGTFKKEVRLYSFAGKLIAKLKFPDVVTEINSADVNNDQLPEMITAGYDNVIRVVGREGTLKSFKTPGVSALSVGDVNGDGIPEIIYGGKDNALHVLTLAGQLWISYTGGWVVSLKIGDIDMDGQDEILYGSRDGTIRALKNGEEIKRIDLGDVVNHVFLEDVNGDGKNEILGTALNGRVVIEGI